MADTTWRAHLDDAMHCGGDAGPVEAYAPNEEAFDVQFDDDFGGADGPHVLAWTATHVYFPVQYDGSEWIGSAPRHPQAQGQPHVGGG
jgi:hypothetical protein